MTEAKRDQNRRTVLLGANADDTSVTLPLRVDSVTNRLLMSITFSALPAALETESRKDGNRRDPLYAVTDDANLDVRPVATDTDGNLLIDLEIL